MYNTIEFQKFVDIIDESVMQLILLKYKTQFPEPLKKELLNILTFFTKTKNDQLEEVLHDKKISIDIKDLNTIKEKMRKVNIDDIDIPDLVLKVKNIGVKKLTKKDIYFLESALLNLSIPLWQTVLSEKSYE